MVAGTLKHYEMGINIQNIQRKCLEKRLVDVDVYFFSIQF